LNSNKAWFNNEITILTSQGLRVWDQWQQKGKVIVKLLQLVPNQWVELSKNYKNFKVSDFEMKENPKHFNATTNSPQSKNKPIWG
jgi:hypothetical protein